MPGYTQAGRPLSVTTPLGTDKLLLVGLRAYEGISTLFRYEFDLLAERNTAVPFEGLLGQRVTATLKLSSTESRYFSGFVSGISQGARDETFTDYRLEVVPQFWLLTRHRQSRIFQYLSVPDILHQVLAGLDVVWEIQGTFDQREYCVQYRETDFEFASRLMEEEGIYYFFKHSSSGHQMVVANTPQSHEDSKPESAIYEEITGGTRPELRVYSWQKTQSLRSGKTTLWDANFELPGKHLDASKTIVDTIQVGTVTQKLKVGGNDSMEIYDFPGDYANRYDGVNRSGGDSSSELQKIFQENSRTVEVRMQEEASRGLEIRGASTCPQFTAGYRFKLERHFNADDTYVLTAVEHRAVLHGAYRSGRADVNLAYDNSFTCIPLALPFRPPRVTQIPHVYGAQTAVVVGPQGEEIFTDKYGRIKVQFMWDRQGESDGDSSCWVRVATPWAGKQWGMIHIPRIGQEVVVEFVDGNVDHPLVVGSVYNAEQMPPYTLPDNKTQSGVKSRSSLSGTAANFNEIRFEDKKESELLFIHAEKDQTIEVEHDESHWVGNDRTKTIDRDETTHVKHDRTETVDNNETITIHGNRTETVDKDETITIHQNRAETVDKNETITVHQNRTETVDKDESITISGSQTIKVGKDISITAGKSITLTCGASTITMDTKSISISSVKIDISGDISVNVDSPMTKVNASGVLTLNGSLTKIN
ncbi:MAG TPA: type VI secretion system tip protein TssI/VgrG [Candidatus Acidoferrales bacterium]|nr:type VI secretion system tip protein TssI/VgrG [Candidatus Acidoferrales bacterium]